MSGSRHDPRFPWPVEVLRDSHYLMDAVRRVSSDRDQTPEEMARRLAHLGELGVLFIDSELLPGTLCHVVGPEVTPEGDVFVRYWSDHHQGYDVDRFPLTALGDRRRKGARTRPEPWREVPWETSVTSAPSA